ncbi:hypothetical protein D3C80_952110 [compost metagenome]
MDLDKFLNENVGNVGDERVSIENYLTVSEEGFFQSIGDVFRNIRHGRPPKLTDDKGDPRLNKDTLSKTYLNPEWLAKRRFLEGEVKVSQHGKPFTGDYNGAMRKLADAWVKSNQANKKISDPYYARVKPSFEFVAAYGYSKPDKLAAHLETMDLKFVAPKFSVLGQEYDVSKEGATLPALTKEQVTKLVASLIYLGDSFFNHTGFHDAWDRDFATTLNGRWYLYSPDGAKMVANATYGRDVENNRNCFRLINDVYDFSARYSHAYYNRSCVGYDAFYAWMRGCIAWIDASVK